MKVYKYGANVDTDVIIPARHLNDPSPAALASHCMEDIDADFASTVEEGDIMDTILFHFINLIGDSGGFTTTLILYLVIFVFELFIQSGSAKALLLMPIIFDICTLVGIDGQVAVLAFAFADGFSNVILPTNAGLLLILGLTTVDYGTWFKWSLKIHLTLFAATIGVLALAQYVFYV